MKTYNIIRVIWATSLKEKKERSKKVPICFKHSCLSKKVIFLMLFEKEAKGPVKVV